MKKSALLALALGIVLIGCSGGDKGTDTTTKTDTATTQPANADQGKPAGGQVGGPGGPGGDAGKTAGPSQAVPTDLKPATYAEAQKVFDTNCIKCHGENGRAGIDLRSFASIGNKRGLIKAGDVEHSMLATALRGRGTKLMPPRSGGIPEDQIRIVEGWIMSGAKEK